MIKFTFRSKNWKPCYTVLFLADMRVDWSNFYNGMIVGFNSRSIVIEDPDIAAAEELRNYAKQAPVTVTAYIDSIAAKIPAGKFLVI